MRISLYQGSMKNAWKKIIALNSIRTPHIASKVLLSTFPLDVFFKIVPVVFIQSKVYQSYFLDVLDYVLISSIFSNLEFLKNE